MNQPPDPPAPEGGWPSQPQQPYRPAPYQPYGQPAPYQPSGQPFEPYEPLPPTQGDAPYPPQLGWTAQLPAWSGQPVEPPAPRRSGRRKVLVASVLAAAVIAGAAVSYVALADKGTYSGAKSPRAAVDQLVKDLDNSDILGVLDHLPPAERASIVDPVRDQIAQLKRVRVFTSAANAHNVSGLKITVSGLTYDPAEDRINDHVSVVQLTGGKVTVNVDLDKIPYTREFLDAALKGHSRPTGSRSRTVDLGEIARTDGHPIRVAAAKVRGKWYPSLLYTVADNAVHSGGSGQNPTAADFVPASGANSAEDVVRQALAAAGRQDARALVGLLSPEEMAVAHDYGGLIVKNAQPDSQSSFTVNNATFSTSKVSGGVLVSVKSVDLTTSDGHYAVAVDGDCVRYIDPHRTQTFCAKDALREWASRRSLTTDEQGAIDRLFAGLLKVGLVTTQSGGRWYLSPVRSYGDASVTVLEGLHSGDVITLLKLLGS
jgi:hypothetical protein